MSGETTEVPEERGSGGGGARHVPGAGHAVSLAVPRAIGEGGARMDRSDRGIPRAWWRLFVVEVPLVAGTVVYTLAAPRAFAASAFGIERLDGPAHTLLFAYASVVATAVGWFYARLLFAKRIDLPTFRIYQEALLLGDVGVVALWSWSLAAGAAHGPSPIAGIAMAAFWGAVRVVFLLRVRGEG